MKKIQNFMDGKKAYLMGSLAIVYGLSGYFLGYLDAAQTQEAIWAGLTTIALRAGIAKK